MNEEAVCAYCGKAFIKTRPNMVYCSPQCRYKTNTEIAKYKIKFSQSYDKSQYPNADRIQCRKCDKWFESWDKVRNRLCRLCVESNRNVRNDTSVIRTNHMIGRRPRHG